jgi:hypothetical protein
MKLPTAAGGVAAAIVEEARSNLNHRDTEKLSNADLLYLKRQVQRRMGGGAEVGQLKSESERDTRDDLSREFKEELEMAGLHLPDLKHLTGDQLEALHQQIFQKRRGGAKKFRSRTSDSTQYLKHFSMPQSMIHVARTWGRQILLCFLVCVFLVMGIALLIASTME